MIRSVGSLQNILVGAICIAFVLALGVSADITGCASHGITVKRFNVDGQISGKFYFLGDNNDIVLVSTNRGKLYKSEDGGATWTQITNMPNQPSNLAIGSIAISKDKKQVLVSSQAVNCTGCLFIAQVEGKKLSNEWQRVDMKYRIDSFEVHPNQEGWIAALIESKECYNASAMNLCNKELIFSTNFGRSWTHLWSYVSQFSWAGAGTNGIPDNQLIVIDWENKTGNYRNKQYIEPRRALRSVDFFSTNPTELQDGVTGFLAIGDDLFIVKNARQGGLELHTSLDLGRTWQKSTFPHETSEQRYTILDTTEGSVFINIQHENLNWGNVYTSDSYGGRFTLSLPRNPRYFITGQCDFTRVLGIDGIYLANQYEETGGSGRDAMTKMSFNKGSTWERIPAPANDPTPCHNDCYLNLHGTTTDTRNKFISRRYSPGVLLGTGNVGAYLSNQQSSKNTYLSNDAGKTWYWFANGTYEYEIANYGGLIMMAKNSEATKTVFWTEDEGRVWSECALDENFANTNESFEITDIVAEPRGGAPEFIIYGHPKGQVNDVIFHLDLTGVRISVCKGWDSPGTPESDFEYWVPTTNTNSCEMGRKTQYIRKKPQVDCLIPEDYDPVKSSKMISNCQCTAADWECDLCFERDESGKCVLSCNEDPRKPPAVCKDFYYETQGYRLVPGNSCNVSLGGVNLFPIQKACPPSVPTDTSGPDDHSTQPDEMPHNSSLLWAIVIPIVAIIVATIGILYALSGRSSAIRSCCCLPESWLPEFKPPVSTYTRLPTEAPSMTHVSVDIDDEPAAPQTDDLLTGPTNDTTAEQDAELEFDPRK